jgi:sn-glycerol 3-phosphate transport system permease protein
MPRDGYTHTRCRLLGNPRRIARHARREVPTLVAFSLFSAVYHWNDFFWLLVITTIDPVRTLPIGVAMLREEGTGARWHSIMAGSMFVVAPVLLVSAVAQRHIIRAFTFTSLR